MGSINTNTNTIPPAPGRHGWIRLTAAVPGDFRLYSLLLVMLFTSGCMAPVIKGPDFAPDSTPVADQGKIYIYWTKTGDRATRQDFTMTADGAPLRTMIQGGYFVYKASPGELTLTSPPNFTYGSMAMMDLALATVEELKIQVTAGETYYVRCALAGYRGNYRLLMSQVSADSAMDEIKTTKLLPDDSKNLKEIDKDW